MRLFFAVFPPPDVARAVSETVEALRRPGDGVSWVKTDNVHYTLRFLGELGESRAAAAARAGEAAVVGLSRFALKLGGPGAFPSARKPRVLWLGATEGGEELGILARSLEEALRRERFEPADRPFAPHLTLGRVRDPGGGGAAGAVAEAFLRGAFPAASFPVESLLLIHSTLHPQGSRYEPIGRYTLGPA